MKYALIKLCQMWSNSNKVTMKYSYKVGYENKDELDIKKMFFKGITKSTSLYSDAITETYFIGAAVEVVNWDYKGSDYKEVAYTTNPDEIRLLIMEFDKLANPRRYKKDQLDWSEFTGNLTAEDEFLTNHSKSELNDIIKHYTRSLNYYYKTDISNILLDDLSEKDSTPLEDLMVMDVFESLSYPSPTPRESYGRKTNILVRSGKEGLEVVSDLEEVDNEVLSDFLKYSAQLRDEKEAKKKIEDSKFISGKEYSW